MGSHSFGGSRPATFEGMKLSKDGSGEPYSSHERRKLYLGSIFGDAMGLISQHWSIFPAPLRFDLQNYSHLGLSQACKLTPVLTSMIINKFPSSYSK